MTFKVIGGLICLIKTADYCSKYRCVLLASPQGAGLWGGGVISRFVGGVYRLTQGPRWDYNALFNT